VETLGGLVDQLTTVSMKLWHEQDKVMQYAQETLEQFRQHPMEELHGNYKKVNELNLLRNRLMTEIDRCFARGVSLGKAEIDPRIKVLPPPLT
jgi:hypothetical protein